MQALAAAASNNIHDLSLQELSNMAWAFARLSYKHNPLMASISAASISTLAQWSGGNYGAHDLSMTVWSYSKLGIHDFPLMNALSSASIARLTHFEP